MKLSIKNFAKIKEAEIKVDGITVIAGENNTGKSTVGKILFSMFNSMNNIDDKLLSERTSVIEDTTRHILFEYFLQHFSSSRAASFSNAQNLSRKIARQIMPLLTNSSNPEEIYNAISDIIVSHNSILEGDRTYEISSAVTDNILSMSDISDDVLFLEVVTRFFNNTFNDQINSLSQNNLTAILGLEIKRQNIDLFFEENTCVAYNSSIWLLNKAIYIDNPFIMDSLDTLMVSDATEYFLKSLINRVSNQDIMVGIIESVVAKEKLEEINKILETVVDGDIVQKNGEEFYLEKAEFREAIKISNLSTGLKSFVLIKMLLEKGIIKEKDVLILDEPEIHLHPQWQIAYAEIIVLLQKYFDLSIVVATHSPYFLDAINLFSIKHGISEKTNYYLSSSTGEGVTMELVTSELDKIYKKMASPIQELETLRYELNNNQ